MSQKKYQSAIKCRKHDAKSKFVQNFVWNESSFLNWKEIHV